MVTVHSNVHYVCWYKNQENWKNGLSKRTCKSHMNFEGNKKASKMKGKKWEKGYPTHCLGVGDGSERSERLPSSDATLTAWTEMYFLCHLGNGWYGSGSTPGIPMEWRWLEQISTVWDDFHEVVDMSTNKTIQTKVGRHLGQ